MSERYSKIFSLLPQEKEAEIPVSILAGALLRENASGQLLAQVKYQNNDSRIVVQMTVAVTLLDADGKPIGEYVPFCYKGLDVQTDTTFGDDVPIVVENPSAGGFEVCVEQIVFADDSRWSADGNETIILADNAKISQKNPQINNDSSNFNSINENLPSFYGSNLSNLNQPSGQQQSFDIREKILNKTLLEKNRRLLAGIGIVVLILALAVGVKSLREKAEADDYTNDYGTYDDDYDYGDTDDDYTYTSDEVYKQMAATAVYSEIEEQYPRADAGSSRWSVNKVTHTGDNVYVYGTISLYDKYGKLTSDFSKTFEVVIKDDGSDITCTINS